MDTLIYFIPWIISGLVIYMITRPSTPMGSTAMRPRNAPVTNHGAPRTMVYVIGGCLVMTATLTGFYDNFASLTTEQWHKLGWWQIVSLVCKSMVAAPVALAGYLIESPLSNNQKPTK